MRLMRIAIFVLCVGLGACKTEQEEDATSAFMEAAQALINDKDAVGGLSGAASAFMQSDTGKQVTEMLMGGKSNGNGAAQILAGLGSLFAGNAGGQGMDLSFVSNLVDSFAQSADSNKKTKRAAEPESGGFDFESMMNVASMFLGKNGNAEGLMGLLPMVLENFGNGVSEDTTGFKKHDHSGHSWFLPPILENLHVMWEHFSNSELGQTLWKNSGLAKIVGTMTDADGNLEFEKMFNSFENPTIRRRWIKTLTNYVSEWISHVSDPATQQRYLATAQFVGNGFLKSQGYPKSAMFDATKPANSIARIVNAMAKRHLNMKIDSLKYIKPAVAYFQELTNLASQKGLIVSHVNAIELSNKLSDTINNDIIEPLLKAYRAYKWATKSPKCAAHILCIINEKTEGKPATLRSSLTKLASFPAAWAISNKTGLNFWTLYGAVVESERCFAKHPVDCKAFHEEEIRVTTEYVHSEL